MSSGPANDPTAGRTAPPNGAVRAVVTICNQKGLHARAAVRFVKTAGQFDAEVRVRKNGTEVPGSDIMELLMLGAAPGAVIETRPPGYRIAVAPGSGHAG